MKQLIVLTVVMGLMSVPAILAADGKPACKPACCVVSKAECAKAPGQAACCAKTCKGTKESAKAAKQAAKAAKKSAKAEKQAAKKTSP